MHSEMARFCKSGAYKKGGIMLQEAPGQISSKDLKRSMHKEFVFFFHSPGSSKTPRMPALIPKSVSCLLLCTLIFRLMSWFRKRAEQNLARNWCYYSILFGLVRENKRFLYRVEKKILLGQNSQFPLFTTCARRVIIRRARAHSSAVRAVGS